MMLRQYTGRIRFLVLIGLVVLLAACSSEPENQDTAGAFWERLGVSRDAVEEVRLVFQGQTVTLEERKAAAFLDSLSTLEEKEVADQYEFYPSDIGVELVADGKEYEMVFYWFPYMRGLEKVIGLKAEQSQSLPQMIGNRVDVTIQGKRYHFCFSTEQVWTEDLMCQSYDQCAKAQGLEQMYQLRGGDNWDRAVSPMQEEIPTIDDVLESSEIVFLGTFVTNASDNYFGNIKSVEVFRVDEVLKGNIEEKYYSVFSWHLADRVDLVFVNPDLYYDWVTVVEECFYDPIYQKEKQYLVCIDLDEDDPYPTHCQFGTAVVAGDTLFPRFNTEEHPFYNVKIQTVRDLLAEDQPVG